MDSIPHHAAAWRRPALAIAVLGALFMCLALATSAFATPGHRYSAQFGSGVLSGPSGLGIAQGSGEVVVTDAWMGMVDVFSASGDFARSWNGAATPAGFFNSPAQVATDGSSVYVADTFNSAVDRFDTSGGYLGQLDPSGTTATVFSMPRGVAIDPVNGDVYVGDSGNNVVVRFDSSGAFVSEIGVGELSSPSQLAVDSNQDLYVLDGGNGRVVKYSGGSLVATVSSNGPAALAVNPADDHVFVAESGPFGSEIAEYTGAGARLSSFGAGRLMTPTGIGVNASTGKVYVADQGQGAVLTFNQVTLPTVATTAGATGVSASEATIAGTVNPEGATASYHFEWGTDTNYGNYTAEVDAGNGTSDVAASEPLTGLSPGTTYHFRIVATNAQGSIQGADQTFTTDPLQVGVDGQAPYASAITTTGASLNATVNPNGASTSYHFEYGTDTSYGSSTADGDAGSVAGDAPVSAQVSGLQPGTTYHFRVVADNGIGGAVEGADATFTTAPAAPPTASDVTAKAATLNGSVNPQGAPATFHFEYGTDTSYGSSTAETSAGSGSIVAPVSRSIAGLAPDTEYHFRLVATVDGQTVTGADASFTTLQAPTATTNGVTAVTFDSANANATVDTHGVAGTLTVFVQSLDSTYTTSPTQALDQADGPRDVAIPLTGLPSGESFVVRAAVTAADATVYGDLVPFSTPAGQIVNPPPPPDIAAKPYGCTTPRLNPIDTKPKPGQTVTVTGSDLGAGGTIALGSTAVDSTSWAADKIAFVVPAGTTGAQALTVNCGRASNTVTLAIARKPSNAFTVANATAKGLAVTLKIRVPGPGKVKTSGLYVRTASKTVTRGKTVRITVRLTKTGKRTLAKANKLPTALRIRFTPAGGTTNTKSRTVTFFKRGGNR